MAPKVERMSWLAHKWYLYELWTGLYMLDPWEKFFFNGIIITIALLSLTYGMRHTEMHTSFIAAIESFSQQVFGGAPPKGDL